MEIIPIWGFKYFSNSYFLVSNGKCAIVDPGQPLKVYIENLEKQNLSPSMILLTHAHFDHMLTCDELRNRFNIPLYVNENEKDFLSDGDKNAYSIFFRDRLSIAAPENTFKDGDKLKIESDEIRVIQTPGHTCGSSCFLFGNNLITGDTLFSNGVGRTDLYSGDSEEQIKSLGKLRALPDGHAITIYPGHGSSAILADALDNIFY